MAVVVSLPSHFNLLICLLNTLSAQAWQAYKSLGLMSPVLTHFASFGMGPKVWQMFAENFVSM